MSEKTYKVDITETLKTTVTVRANNPDEAHRLVAAEWRDGKHVLDADNFTDVDFNAHAHPIERGFER